MKIVVNGDENPYALASEPGAPAVELLFKQETALTTAMAALQEGEEILVGPVQGKGFPVEEHTGHDLILCAAGSGIAPLRGVVREVLGMRDRYGAVTLYYGQRDATEFAYTGEHPEWRAAGVKVVLVTSSVETGERRVQDALRAQPPPVGNAVAYLAGMKGMIAGVREVLGELGMPAERFFLNY